MNNTILTIAAMLAGCAVASAKPQGRPDIPRVEICFEMDGSVRLGGMMFASAKATASQLVAEGGIRLDWSHGKISDCDRGGQSIGIKFVAHAPEVVAERPHALASAMPYGTGETIAVYDDRIARYCAIFPEADQAKILGHILAHEIVHMLQGVARHSSTGLMKARWDTEDLRTISRTGLGMAAEDRQILAARFAPTTAEGTR